MKKPSSSVVLKRAGPSRFIKRGGIRVVVCELEVVPAKQRQNPEMQHREEGINIARYRNQRFM